MYCSLTQYTKSCNGFLLIVSRQHDCVASTQRCDVEVLSFAVPSEVHVEAVFSKPHCSCHLPPQVLRCVIHIHIDDVHIAIKSLDVEFHLCFVFCVFSVVGVVEDQWQGDKPPWQFIFTGEQIVCIPGK